MNALSTTQMTQAVVGGVTAAFAAFSPPAMVAVIAGYAVAVAIEAYGTRSKRLEDETEERGRS